MTYLKGYLSTNTRLDKKCGKGWEGTVGNCKRVKSKGSGSNKVKAPAVGFAKRWENPAFKSQIAGLTAGTFIGVNALQRQGSVIG